MSTNFKIESGMQLLARLIRKPEIGNFYPPLFITCPKNGDIIEISCDSGLPLLVDVICEVLVSYKLRGKEVGIILFNTDGNLNYDLLLNFMRQKIIHFRKLDNMLTDFNVEEVLHKTLSNLSILEINDATQLYTTIHKLENILMEQSNILLVIFDTLTAFYWSEQEFKITKMDTYVKNLLQIIKKVTKEYKITCMYTRPHYFNSNKDADHTESWVTETLDYRIVVTKRDGAYKVNIRTNEMQYIKYFQVTGSEMKWL